MMQKRQQIFINNAWHDADNGEQMQVHNPATGALIGHVPNGGPSEANRAIDAAHQAFGPWRGITADERGRYLSLFFEALMDRKKELGAILTEEMGKPLAEGEGEIVYGAKFFRWFAEEAKRVYGDIIPSPWPGKQIMVTKQPVGVVGAITPWNFPSSMIARKLAASLAAGCPLVLKPAPATPFSALAFGDLALDIGLPKGVINIVTGNAEPIGDAFCTHEKVRKITFTGSTKVGKLLAAKAGANMKRISMELGGNAPFLVFDDADLDGAVAGAMASKFRNSGQTCVCANRFFVQSGIYDAFAEKFAVEISKLTVGDGTKAGVNQGPLINEQAAEKVRSHVSDAIAQGAKVVQGEMDPEKAGMFFEPTLILDVTSKMKLFREETFGPVAGLIRFDDEADAIAMANDTEYGLAAYAYTRDLGRAFRLSQNLDYGMVGINEGIVSTEVAPFGGVKESGLGNEGSKYGIEDYISVKYTLIGGLEEAKS